MSMMKREVRDSKYYKMNIYKEKNIYKIKSTLHEGITIETKHRLKKKTVHKRSHSEL